MNHREIVELPEAVDELSMDRSRDVAYEANGFVDYDTGESSRRISIAAQENQYARLGYIFGYDKQARIKLLSQSGVTHFANALGAVYSQISIRGRGSPAQPLRAKQFADYIATGADDKQMARVYGDGENGLRANMDRVFANFSRLGNEALNELFSGLLDDLVHQKERSASPAERATSVLQNFDLLSAKSLVVVDLSGTGSCPERTELFKQVQGLTSQWADTISEAKDSKSAGSLKPINIKSLVEEINRLHSVAVIENFLMFPSPESVPELNTQEDCETVEAVRMEFFHAAGLEGDADLEGAQKEGVLTAAQVTAIRYIAARTDAIAIAEEMAANERELVASQDDAAYLMIPNTEDKEWQELSNCLGVDPELFFPERGASTREAKAVCRGCVVREDCLEYALSNGEKFGIWGGMSERERRRIRRQRALARVASSRSSDQPELE